MKKYYAVECDPENFDYEMYYNEFDAENDQAWFGGNRDFTDINAGLKNTIVEILQDLNDEFEDNDCINSDLSEVFSDFLKGRILTNLEKERLANLVIEFSHYTTASVENNVISEVLSIVTGIPYTSGCIRGYCQSDWMYYICPSSLDIDYISAVFFATGKEFRITDEPIESFDDFDSVETVYDYTNLYKEEDIKKWLAENINCSEEQLVVKLIDNIHMTRKYDYKTI